MAGQVKVNPAATTVPMNVVGKDLQFFTIDYIEAINGSAGPLGAQKAAIDAIQTTCTILAAGPLHNSNTEQTCMVEGSDVVTAATLQALIRALGTVDSFNHANDVVTAKNLEIGT